MFTGLTSPTHMMILALLVIVLFGAKRLPEIGRSLGTGMREFKDSVTNATPQTPLELVMTDEESLSHVTTNDKESVAATSIAS